MDQFELFFDTLTANSNDLIIAVDARGIILLQSPSVKQQLSCHPDSSFSEIIHPEDQSGFNQTLHHSIADPGIPNTLNLRLLKKNGDYLFVKTICTSHLNKKAINALLINIWPVGEKDKQVISGHDKASINQIYERVLLATQAADVGIWDWDVQANILVWNNTMYRLYGLEKGDENETIESFRSRLHPADRERVSTYVQLALNGTKNYNVEFRRLMPDGSIRYTRSIGFVKRDAHGTPLRMGGTNWDITQQKLDEEQLADASKQLTILFNSVDEMLISADMVTDQLIQISPACEKIYGYTPAEFYADSTLWFNSIHPDDQGFVFLNREKFQQNEACSNQYRIFAKGGGIKWIEEKITPTLDENGRLIRIDGVMHDITQKKNAEEDLKKSEHNYQLLVNGIDGIVWEAEAQTLQFTFVSNASERILGYPSSAWLGSNTFWADHIHPDDRAFALNYCTAGIREKRSHELEYRMIAANGDIIWIRDLVTVVLENDEPVYLRGIMMDITARKKSEQIIREAEARYRRIVETAQEGIWTIDEHNKTNFVNKAISEMLEYSPAEMMGREPFDFMTPSELPAALVGMDNLRNGLPENLDLSYLTKSGKMIWANVLANPVFDDHGHYKGALAMLTDITQRKLDEENLKKSEANLRTIFNNTDSAYVMIDTDQKIISFNQLAQTFSEIENGKSLVVNASIMDYFTPDYQVFIQQVLKRALEGEVVSYELSRDQPEGTERWYRIRWVKVTNSDHKHVGYILNNKDITANKLAALEREKIIADLVQRNKDQEQFTYIISHNLRAPVANIMGLTELLSSIYLDPGEKQEIMDGITTSIQALDDVIMDINHVLQVKEKIRERKESVDFQQLVNDIKVSISSTIAAEQVAITCNFEEVQTLFTIRSYLYSIFYNLLLNSIKYRKNGIAPQINVSSHMVYNKVILKFSDNGKGINMAKNKAHIFGLYKRFDTSVEGKGMGLYMIKSQVEALGGTVSVISELESGTQFTIILPS